MGVAVSNWRLARAVSRMGELGVISGTLLAVVLARRLADGDADGDMRRALGAFPIPGVAERVIDAHFIPGGREPGAAYRGVPMPTLKPGAALTELTVAANFVEVYLAKEGHGGMVGINLLEKIQLATLPSLYGAMLAQVDYVLMGAGIPRSIPGTLDRFAAGEAVRLKVDVAGGLPGEDHATEFDPKAFCGGDAPRLSRPHFLAIVSSATLALTLARKSNGRVDGFVVEGDVAGGHNAPPRGPMQLSQGGEPVYGARDIPDLAKIRELGLPFWLAGGRATPERLADAVALGAAGIQVGTAFAFCDESGVEEIQKREAIRASRAGTARVFTDPAASPTGFPFKVAQMPGTLSEAEGLRAARTDLRPGTPAPALPEGGRRGGVPLPRRAGRRLSAQGRRRLGSLRPQMPVQRARGHGGPWPGARRDPRGGAGHGRQRIERARTACRGRPGPLRRR